MIVTLRHVQQPSIAIALFRIAGFHGIFSTNLSKASRFGARYEAFSPHRMAASLRSLLDRDMIHKVAELYF